MFLLLTNIELNLQSQNLFELYKNIWIASYI